MVACSATPARGWASGQTAAGAPGYSTRQAAVQTAPIDSCSVWRRNAAVFREAYRVRLHDLADARAAVDSTAAAGRLEADSLRVRLGWLAWELEGERQRQPGWWEGAGLQFMAGAVSMILLFTLTGAIE